MQDPKMILLCEKQSPLHSYVAKYHSGVFKMLYFVFPIGWLLILSPLSVLVDQSGTIFSYDFWIKLGRIYRSLSLSRL